MPFLPSSRRPSAPERLEPRTLLSNVPAGFDESLIASGITSPTAIEYAPDGRLFVSEQTGSVRVIKNGQVLATPFVTVTEDSSAERGLYGVAFDPNFASNRFVYLFYTYLVPGQGSGSTQNPNRVSRFTADPANPDRALAGSEVVLLETPGVGNGIWHMGGAVECGPDGKLYVTVGDYVQPVNAQSMDVPMGKVLRINTDGSIPTDNPFYDQTTGISRAIWALGLRNPFTAAFQPGTGRYYINDVGLDQFEEINEGAAGANFGWPGTEGPFDPSEHLGYTNPVHAYSHAEGCAITGGTFYNPAAEVFPQEYVGKYFFTDICGGYVNTLDPQTREVQTFATGLDTPTGLTAGDDGALYYISRGAGFGGTPNTGRVFRIRYASAEPPSVTAPPRDALVSAGDAASFSVSAAGAGPLSYQWQRANPGSNTFNNVSGATADSYTLNSAALGDNGARYRVRVTSPYGDATSAAATLTVTSNRRPTATMTSPAAGTLFFGGRTINYAGSASDPETGNLPAGAFSWRVDFHHHTHVHPFVQETPGSAGGSFTVPTTAHADEDVWYRIHLTVRDPAGLTTTTFRDVFPRTSRVTLASNVPGLRLLLEGVPSAAPRTFTHIEGMLRNVEAPATQFLNGTVYQFSSWSDGGTRAHEITTPAADTTYTAVYREVESANLFVEAESANPLASPMARGDDPAAGGGEYAGTAEQNLPTFNNPDDPNAGAATFSFNAPAAGNYALWARVFGASDGADSWWVRVDNGSWMLWDFRANGSWGWDQIGHRQPGAGPQPGSQTLVNLTAGAHTLTIKEREDGARLDQILITRDTTYVPPADLIADTTLPRVERVYVTSTRWSTRFKAAMAGSGSGIGYRVPDGSTAAQLTNLPWVNVNQFRVRFTEAMNVASLQSAAAALRGSRTANYPLTFGGYDPATRLATWTLSGGAVLRSDRVRLVLPHTITDSAGTKLDGNWTTGQSFNSGNRFAGGEFNFALNLLPGDVTRNGSVDLADVRETGRRQLSRTTRPGGAPYAYTVFHDVDGNGCIGAVDVWRVRSLQGTSLPAGALLADLGRGRQSRRPYVIP